jgi:hypothetical protein
MLETMEAVALSSTLAEAMETARAQVTVPSGSAPPQRASPASSLPPADSAAKSSAAAVPEAGEEQTPEDEVAGEVGTPTISTLSSLLCRMLCGIATT